MDARNALNRLALAAASSALVAASWARTQEPERGVWERIDLPSIAACGTCHERVYREWSQSLHHRAWTNANVRHATDDFAKESCRPCHSPQPVLPTGLDRPPDYRDVNQEDGVHCLSCHGLTDGVAAARTIEDAPCRPRRSEGLLSADSCWPCHQPTHQAFDEYRASRAFDEGVRCADCHMPERADGGRSHGPNGGLNPEFVRGAVDWDVELGPAEVRVTVTNRTGHKFPGEIPSRVFEVRLEVPGHEARAVALRKPHKGEDRPDDRLEPDETRVFAFDLPPPGSEGVEEARVVLTFRPLPLLPDGGAFVIGERTWRRP